MPRNKKRHKKVVGLNGDQNRQLSSEEVTRVFGLSIVDSGCSSDSTEFASAQGSTSENEKGLYNSQENTNLKYESACGDEPRKATSEICYELTSSTPSAPPLNESESSPSFQSRGLPVLDCSQSGKIRFLCSFGGKIMPRPSDKKLRYVGGDTRIITTRKNLSWKELMKKISAICEQPQTVKYQLPGEDLDALVSVSSDEDLQNMLEDYHGFEQVESFQRLRIFLFPLSESANSCTLDTNAIPQNDPEYQYVVAVNGMVGEDPSPLKNRTGQPLQGEASHLIPNVELDKLPRGTAECPVLSSSEFHTIQVAENLMSLHPSRGIVTPSGPEEIDNNSEQCSSTGPIPKERTVKREKSLSIPNNPIGALLGSNDSAGFHDGMSYAVSRSNFLESGGKSIYCSEEVMIPPAKLNFPITHISPQVASAASEEDAGRLQRSKKQFRDENSHNSLQREVPESLGVGSNVPPDAESSLGRVHQVIGTVESSSPSTSATGSESISQDSDSEDTYDGGGSCNELITDAMIAEMEANVYGLQIIRNAELEEIRELGSGTYGTVYHGKWRGTDVAIKRIKKACISGVSSEKERLIKDFWREARILSNLHHPNIVALYGIVPDGEGGTLATVTEYMPTGSLKNSLLKKDRSLDCPRRLMVALDAAFGMEYLHSKNIVHFDLKCENLLVNLWDPQRPICKVGDFGLSRIKHKTLLSGGVRGTLPWMAPELLNGSTDQVSEKVDVFSFGISMWEILTGEEPYADMHCGAIIGGIVKNKLRPPIPEGCDLHWKKLMEECWESDPEARPSFSEITRRLREMRVNLLDRWESNLSRQRKQNISM